LATSGQAALATGQADGAVVSLGDGGYAEFTLTTPLRDRDGADFAVFENGFFSPMDNGYFLELAVVEVSSNGTDFVRFPAHSLVDTTTQVGPFQVMDPTQLNNLAGKYASGYGVPFDLFELNGSPNLDILAITHIRVIDVVGDITASATARDTAGNPINDPWPTDFTSSGFDLDALAFLQNEFPVGVGLPEVDQPIVAYPNPMRDQLFLKGVTPNRVEIYAIDGTLQWEREGLISNSIYVSGWADGIYFMVVHHDQGSTTQQLIKRSMY